MGQHAQPLPWKYRDSSYKKPQLSLNCPAAILILHFLRVSRYNTLVYLGVMQWLEDIPLELRLVVYGHLCESTPVLVHNLAYSHGCSFFKDGNRHERVASTAVALLLSCKAVKVEFEPIFMARTPFYVHMVPSEHNSGCFNYMYHLDGFAPDKRVEFFRPIDRRRRVEDFVSWGYRDALRGHLQLLMHRHEGSRLRHLRHPGSFIDCHLERFIISEPLGCDRYPGRRQTELRLLVQLLNFCRGRVREVEFWYHPMGWEPVETAVPWHVRVDIDTNFTIRGPSREGFQLLKAKFRRAIFGSPPRSRRGASPESLAYAAVDLRFIFVEDHEAIRPDGAAHCCREKQRKYKSYCNCGLPACMGGWQYTDEYADDL